MSIYSEAWERHTQKFISVAIEGGDATDRVISVQGLEIGLDTPDLTTFRASDLVITLDNRDNDFSPEAASNFFTAQAYAAHGHLAEVSVSLGFRTGAGDVSQQVICGLIADIDTQTVDAQARITCVDGSIKLRDEPVHNIGFSRFNVQLVASGDYSKFKPLFEFPQDAAPLSKESIANMEADAAAVTIIPAVRSEGKDLTYQNAEVDHNNALLLFEAEPPSQESTVVDCDYKEPYRYKRPDFLARRVLELGGYTSADFDFVEPVALRHFNTTDGNQWFSSHGRVNWDLLPDAILRWVVTDWLRLDVDLNITPFLYFLTDFHLIEYDWNNDAYTQLASLPTGTSGSTYTGFQMASADATVFFILMTDDLEGDSSSSAIDNAIYKWDSGAGWVKICDNTDEHPQVGMPYDILGAGLTVLSDNRKGFTVINDPGDSKDYLYFIFAEPLGAVKNAGLKRYSIPDTTFATVYSQPYSTSHDGLEYGYDFAIDLANTKIYHFLCYDDSTYGVNGKLEVVTTNLSGGSPTSIWTESFTGNDKPISATDIVIDDANSKVYFHLQLQHLSSIQTSKGELSYIPTSGGSRTVIKTYDPAGMPPIDFIDGARSGLLSGDGYAYYAEGDAYRYNVQAYTETGGHLLRLDNGTLTDMGRIWKSAETPDPDDPNQDGFGVHGACTSNIVHDGDLGFSAPNLYFAAGYGEIYSTIDAASHPRAFPDSTDPMNRVENYAWLQWGFSLASKLERYTPNDKACWGELTNLAKICNYELGFDCDKPIFRKRGVIKNSLATAIAGSGAVSTIDLNDGSGFPKTAELPDGVGYVLIGQEVFTFTGRSVDTLTGVTRAQDESAEAAHSEADVVWYIHFRAFNHRRLKNLVAVEGNRPEYTQVWNQIRVPFAVSQRVDDNDATSVAAHGKRPLDLQVDYLESHDRPWAEIIAREYRDNYATLQNLVTMTLTMTPAMQVGQTVLVDQPERTNLAYRVCRILRVSHDFEGWRTRVTARTLV